jgi:hypothetical protein
MVGMITKDVPRLLAKQCHLITLHHFACGLGVFLFLRDEPASGARLFIIGMVIMEIGSALSSLCLCFMASSPPFFYFFFVAFTASNVIPVFLIALHVGLQQGAGGQGAWSIFAAVILPVLVYFRQKSANGYLRSFRAYGYAWKKSSHGGGKEE